MKKFRVSLFKLLYFVFFIVPLVSASQTWSPLGTGMNGPVSCLTFYNGDLIAGGAFTTAGGISAKNIAKWNGSSWSPLGAGFNNAVNSLKVYNGELYAVGFFTLTGSKLVIKVAKWNGVVWDTVSKGIFTSDWVGATEVYNNKLYIGGHFLKAGYDSVSHIASWDGSRWSDPGGGVSLPITPGGAYVECLKTYNGELYAGGSFLYASDTAAKNIASWDGTYWHSLHGYNAGGVGTNGQVAALGVYNGELILGGSFSVAGGMMAYKVAKYDGLN